MSGFADLDAESEGLMDSVTARAAAQVVRMALHFALLDGAERIDLAHLRAALAVWRYSEDTCRRLWGTSSGNPLADKILAILKAAPGHQLTRTQLSKALKQLRTEADHRRSGRDDTPQSAPRQARPLTFGTWPCHRMGRTQPGLFVLVVYSYGVQVDGGRVIRSDAYMTELRKERIEAPASTKSFFVPFTNARIERIEAHLRCTSLA